MSPRLFEIPPEVWTKFICTQSCITFRDVGKLAQTCRLLRLYCKTYLEAVKHLFQWRDRQQLKLNPWRQYPRSHHFTFMNDHQQSTTKPICSCSPTYMKHTIAITRLAPLESSQLSIRKQLYNSMNCLRGDIVIESIRVFENVTESIVTPDHNFEAAKLVLDSTTLTTRNETHDDNGLDCELTISGSILAGNRAELNRLFRAGVQFPLSEMCYCDFQLKLLNRSTIKSVVASVEIRFFLSNFDINFDDSVPKFYVIPYDSSRERHTFKFEVSQLGTSNAQVFQSLTNIRVAGVEFQILVDPLYLTTYIRIDSLFGADQFLLMIQPYCTGLSYITTKGIRHWFLEGLVLRLENMLNENKVIVTPLSNRTFLASARGQLIISKRSGNVYRSKVNVVYLAHGLMARVF